MATMTLEELLDKVRSITAVRRLKRIGLDPLYQAPEFHEKYGELPISTEEAIACLYEFITGEEVGDDS